MVCVQGGKGPFRRACEFEILSKCLWFTPDFGCSLSCSTSPCRLDQTKLQCLRGDAWLRVGWRCQHVWEEQRLQHASSPPSPAPPLPTIALSFHRSLVGVKAGMVLIIGKFEAQEKRCVQGLFLVSLLYNWSIYISWGTQKNKLWINSKLAKSCGAVKAVSQKKRLWMCHRTSILLLFNCWALWPAGI